MTMPALRASLLGHLLLFVGCSMHVTVRPPVAPDALASAKGWASTIAQAFPAYRQDPISQYEQPEIANVERDLEGMQDETDDALFIEEAELLKKD